MGYKEHKARSLEQVRCAVLTVSDTRTRETDESGGLIEELLKDGGHVVVARHIVENDAGVIREWVKGLHGVQVVITTGGTGIGPKDVTIEALSPLMEKELPGFGELFRSLSREEIGSGAIMTRSTAGVIDGIVVICLPGSLGAVRLAMSRIVLPEIGHMTMEVSKRYCDR